MGILAPGATSALADKGTLTVTRGGTPVTLEFGKDYIPGGDPEKLSTLIDAGVVFAGYGIVAPHYQRDDYKGVNVKGKIVAILGGALAGVVARSLAGVPEGKRKSE